MDFSLLIIFWYGVLHAFAPDHLTAIIDFSLGKDKAKTTLITLLFAIGHGVSLFIFAKILQSIDISADILSYGDTISAIVIISMGIYLLFMVADDRIHLKRHIHNGEEHTHIWFGKSHQHSSGSGERVSSLSMGVLMGIGGVRGMLVTLGAISSSSVNLVMVGAFTAGVMVIFVGFGIIILYINENFLGNITNVRRGFALAGVTSFFVGTNILIG
jgi:ABC-type nickel/cobalt efflux system permease component RcnA